MEFFILIYPGQTRKCDDGVTVNAEHEHRNWQILLYSGNPGFTGIAPGRGKIKVRESKRKQIYFNYSEKFKLRAQTMFKAWHTR